jgi:hypothetical protein
VGICDLCGKESNLIFLCSKCGNRYCREHRNPEVHECISTKVVFDEEIHEVYTEPEDGKPEFDVSVLDENQIEVFFEETSTDEGPESTQILEEEGIQVLQVEVQQEDEKEEIIDEEPLKEVGLEEEKSEKRSVSTRFSQGILSSVSLEKGQIVLLCISFVLGIFLTSIAGTLFTSPSTEVETLKERYDTLSLHFVNLSSVVQDLQIEIDDKNNELLLLNQLIEEKESEYAHVFDFLEELILSQDEAQVPKLAQIDSWLSEDTTDNLTFNEGFTKEYLSVLLSLKAQQMKWRIGIVEISGNFTSDNVSREILNVIQTDEGLVYIDPQTDNIWWNEQFEETTIDKNWKINNHIVKVTEIIYVLDY